MHAAVAPSFAKALKNREENERRREGEKGEGEWVSLRRDEILTPLRQPRTPYTLL
jgi:hypothetical protein